MATIFVIHDPADDGFVRGTLLKPLPSLGFDRWVSSTALPAGDEERIRDAFAVAGACIVVVSKAARGSETVRSLAASAVGSPRPTIPVRIEDVDPERIAVGLGALTMIGQDDTTVPAIPMEQRVRDGLRQLLPPIETFPESIDTESGDPIEWDEESFSAYVKEAMARHDYWGGATLLLGLARHLRHRTSPYAAAHARKDLDTLRRSRQFRLMNQYAEMVLASGTDDLEVRRQYAQSLIEIGKFDAAIPLLQRNAAAAKAGEFEWLEAHGLLGRVYKQQYVNAPREDAAPAHLRRAIDEYRGVFDGETWPVWHGVNTASLLLRACRDGFDWANPEEAQGIASRILKQLSATKAPKGVPVWDLASRVEALIALDEFKDAELALDDYLTHQDLSAFELGATFRQFHEVLQLADIEKGRSIYDRLRGAADRYRAGGVASSLQQHAGEAPSGVLPIVIRLSDPYWNPGDELTKTLTICARLGTVITARASRAAIDALLADPAVASIEESPSVVDAMTSECFRGLPFMNVKTSGKYHDAAGEFEEKGRHALIAIIDNGIDVLHEAFLGEARDTRIVGIWDQRDGDPSGKPPGGFNYGRFHTHDDIRRYVRTKEVPSGLGRNVNGHGTHVASIAAGRKVDEFYGGVAPAARLLIVKTKTDGEIGYSNSHLEALSFIDAVATEMGCPVVVNVSKGMNAAAHDGKSALEIGFNEFSGGGRKAGRVVVKSAGNERDTQGHAEIHVPANGGEQLRWRRKRHTSGRERIELWWNSGNSFTFTLKSPGGEFSTPVSVANQEVSGRFGGSVPYHMKLTRKHVDNGDSRLRIEITHRSAASGTGAAEEEWMLDIEADTVITGEPIHAWIARMRGTRDDFSKFQNCTNEKNTITVPGTAETVVTVGAVNAALDANGPAFLATFSSKGPTRDGRNKPDVAAPGVCVFAAQGGTSNQVRWEDGTSFAAPHVAGAIALLLSRAVETGRPWPNANQIMQTLRQKTKGFNGHHDPGQGYGVVDVEKLLAAPF